MTQTISRWLSLLILLTFVTVLPATAEEGQIYTVKKGDTLWDLSQRFIDDPYYWPNVWAHNPDITNPHLIFPGQKIRVLDGKLEIRSRPQGGTVVSCEFVNMKKDGEAEKWRRKV